jgi:hypothetical protein
MAQRKRLTPEALQAIYGDIPKEFNGIEKSLALASVVVREFLGTKWFDRHVIPNRRKPAFFTLNMGAAVPMDTAIYRTMDLAELLYNLQHVPGFDQCIARMRSGDIEGTYAELDFGRMLYVHQMPFRYVIPSGVKGSDYDVDVLYPSGLPACADAKCKVEATKFSARSIDDTLERARRQLPDNRPGIVFLKIPPSWMEIAVDVCVAVAHDFLRTTRRVVSVKYYTSPMTFADGRMKVQLTVKEVSNPITDFGNFQNWDIFPPMNAMSGKPPWWQAIMLYPDGKVR